MRAFAAALLLAACAGPPAVEVPFGDTPGIWASELPGNGEPADDME